MVDGELSSKVRFLERSALPVHQRAELRTRRILDAAQKIMQERGSIGFTVQEVLDRSQLSLRSFYLRFAGKDDLLLALLQDVLREPADLIRAGTAHQADPMEALRSAVWVLFDTAASSSTDRHPLVIDLVQHCRRNRPEQVWSAHEPLLSVFTELLARAEAAGQLRAGARPRPTAVLVVQVAMYLAQSTTVGQEDQPGHPLSADEVWDFCATGFAAR